MPRPNPNIPLSVEQPNFSSMLTQLNNNMMADRTTVSNLQTDKLRREGAQQTIDMNNAAIQKATDADNAKELLLLVQSLPDTLRGGNKTNIGQTLSGINDLSDALGGENDEIVKNVTMMAMMNPDMAADFIEKDIFPALRPLHEIFAPTTVNDAARGQAITSDPFDPQNPTASPIAGAVQPAGSVQETFSDVLGENGEVLAQVNDITNRVVESPLAAPNSTSNRQIVQIVKIDGTELTGTTDGQGNFWDATNTPLELAQLDRFSTSTDISSGGDPVQRLRETRIAALIPQFEAIGMSPEESETMAINLEDKRIRTEMTDVGTIRLINDTLAAANQPNAVREIPIASLSDDMQQTLVPRTLYSVSDQVAGVIPFAADVWARIGGQVPGIEAPTNAANARQFVNGAKQTLINSLRQNPRFAQGEADAISEEINIDASIFDSPEALRARMRAVDEGLRTRVANEKRIVDDPQMPIDDRQAARRAITDINNYIRLLGVPRIPETSEFTMNFIQETPPFALKDLMSSMTDAQKVDLLLLDEEVFESMTAKARGF